MEADIADHVWTLEELQTSFSPAHCTQPKFISLRANYDTFCAMSSDATTTLHDLKQLLKDFRDERAWAQFHDAKNLAEAISIEASELLELFLWKTPRDVSKALKSDRQLKKSVEEELADIICFSLNLANAIDIDVSRIVRKKISTNRKKYPVEKAKGTATKYNKL